MKSLTVYRTLALVAIVLLVVSATACSTAWTSEAINIINLLQPAITAALAILAAFGLGLSPNVMTQVQKWSSEATAGLKTVANLIQQYDAAETAAKPGILEEIKAALAVISANLQTILPTLHVDNPDTQAKIIAVFVAIASEMEALIGLVPALQGKVTSHDELKALIAKLKSPKEFRADFNEKAGVFGATYKI